MRSVPALVVVAAIAGTGVLAAQGPVQFVAASQPAFASPFSQGASSGDFDCDGDVDLPQPLITPPFGDLWLDLGAPFAVFATALAPAAGPAMFVFAVPAVPQLAGVQLHVQGLVEEGPGLPARLTPLASAAIQ